MAQSFAEAVSRVAMSRPLTETFGRAQHYAREQGHRRVTLEHLLLSLCEDPDAAPVLQACQIDIGRLATDASSYVGRIEDRFAPGEPGEPVADQDLQRILEYAAAAAHQSRRREINGAIVLAAVVGEGRSAAAQMLRAQGLTFEETIKALQRAAAAARQQAQRPAAEAPPPQPAPLQTAPQPVPQNLPVSPSPPPPAPMPAPGVNGAAPGRAQTPTAEEILASVRDRINASRTQPPRPGAAPAQDAQPLPPEYPPEPVRQPEPAFGDREPPAPSPGQPMPPPPARPAPQQWPHALPQQPSVRPEPGTRQMPPPLAPPAAEVASPGWPGAAPSAPGYPSASAGRPDPRRPQQAGPAPLPPLVAPPPPQPAARRRQEGGETARGPAPQQAPATRAPGASQLPVPTGRGFDLGQLVENIPRFMRAGVPEIVEVRIARADLQNVAVGMEGRGAPVRHDLVVTRAMSVKLKAPEGGFWIETASPETQWIESRPGLMTDDFATWRWTVLPERRGRRRLQLVAAARTVGADGLAAETALPEQMVEVKVAVNYGRAFGRVAGWVIAAVIGGALAKFGESALSLGMQLVSR
jgi:hypothetical protein